MQGTVTKSPISTRAQTRAGNRLIDLVTPVLEEIMRVKAGLTVPSINLRSTVDALLKQVEERGDVLGYKERQLQTVKFALAAFVDETVLINDFPLREEWEKYPLQLGYVGEHLAGLTFFERLEALLKSADGEADIDVIEVCYLCLLLGYKGKYNIYYEEQLKGFIATVADYLRRVGRLRGGALSPHWKVTDQPELSSEPFLPRWVMVWGSVALGLVVLIYIVLSFLLTGEVNEIKQQLLR